MKEKNIKTKIFFILCVIFMILTLIGAYLVITRRLDNAGYSVIPMLFALTFSSLYGNSKKDEKDNEK